MTKSKTKIYTRRGDRGKTWLKNKLVKKDNPLLETIGDLDELLSFLGWAKATLKKGKTYQQLSLIQANLQQLIAFLAGYLPEINFAPQKLEVLIDSWLGQNPINDFVLPGQSEGESRFQIARTICRRCERRLVSLSKTNRRARQILPYLNRLSDFLFVLSQQKKEFKAKF